MHGVARSFADHSWISKTRGRLPHEVHERVFGWVLALIAERGLVRGERIGVDASTMEANAALRAIVRSADITFFFAGFTYAVVRTSVVENCPRVTSKRLSADLLRVAQGAFDFSTLEPLLAVSGQDVGEEGEKE